MRKIKSGFTLIELMIVVAIIGLLAALAIPNFIKFQAKSRQSEAKTNLKALYTAQKAYYGDKQAYCTAMGIIGFLPERNNRYEFQMNAALGGLLTRVTANDPTTAVVAPTNCGILSATATTLSYETVEEDQWKWGAPAVPYAAAQIPSTITANFGVGIVPAAIGVAGAANCPAGACEFVGGAVGNIDNDTTVDQWTISSCGGTDVGIGHYAEGESVNTVDDVNQ
jgi:type IV pilus assembly protein PilA